MDAYASGQWLLFEHGDPIGYEKWRVTTADGARAYITEGGATFPQPHATRTRLDVDAHGRVTALELEARVEGEDAPRTLTARREDANLLHVTRTVTGEAAEELVPLGEATLVDHTSPVFTAVMLRALDLAPGEGREFDAVLVAPLTFELKKQRYAVERLDDGEVAVPAGRFPARVYAFASATTRYKGHVWTDAACNVIRHGDDWALVTVP